MDCNWCAVCSKHFHSDHQASLYCSDECRKADALACCAFHDCDHPDGSTHHDHLTFCHHHRPAIRVPSLPLLNLNPNPSAEQRAHGQQQTNEWTRFLQHQYNSQYHSYSAHTSTHSHHPSSSMGYGHVSSLPRPSHGYHPESQGLVSRFTDPHPPSESFLLSSRLPNVLCQQQHSVSHPILMHRHKPLYHQRRHSSLSTSDTSNTNLSTSSLSGCFGNLTLSSHRKEFTEMAPCEAYDCEQSCVARKNKALPPPTLSPILPPTISNPASLSPTTIAPSSGDKGAISPLSLTPSGLASSDKSDEDGHQDGGSLSHAWPKMDKFFFPDHCCRTSACRTSASTSARAGPTNGNKSNNKKGNTKSKNNNANKKPFVSELPPPPSSATTRRDSNGCIALSASIWGTGWRQVDPLPESFVKTVQKSNLMWAGCEREHHPHTRHHQRHGRDSGHRHGCHNGGGRANNSSNGGHQKSASDTSSWATVCSSRLPRSLQFID
ncbi:hypothetical protein BC939DRAFT_463921 [Gamsiella multidivaricata]|uniref:uncharacterized protein n=1 Tax=Gamsiella multidivaricata TaxID=101098 RepID=UPI00221ED2DA|nr:uncharacterized protein BC939DRAFT_463921 [Gamsiella multidivaricata]KAI7818069.1 hypothetical protein BC939DRAFT_463921 [Gamsiella multidivaricata]